MLTIYPALFLKSVDGDGYTVCFPDLNGCVTEGDTPEEAFQMAEEALGLYLYDLSVYPEASPLQAPSDSDNRDSLFDIASSFSSYVYVDMLEVKKKMNKTTVRKNLSIPSWLNEIALSSNINFSQTLQDALIEKLGL